MLDRIETLMGEVKQVMIMLRTTCDAADANARTLEKAYHGQRLAEDDQR